MQEGLLLGIAVAAYFATPARAIARANAFAFGPIIEVAVLFAGIFVTMAPGPAAAQRERGASSGSSSRGSSSGRPAAALELPRQRAHLSDVRRHGLRPEGIALEGSYLKELLARGPEAAQILAAISCGAVFMGANSYIGNGPNFMVKAIAETHGVKMPSFFGYMAYSMRRAAADLRVVTFVFFR